MKTRNKSLLFVLAAVCGMALSCTDGYESLPVNQFTDEYLFSTTDSAGKVAQEFLNAIYEKLPSGYNRVGNDFLDAASDHDPYQMNPLSYTQEYLDQVNYDDAVKFYRERFANPADFTYIFVGNFDEKVMNEYLCLYLGSMKTSSEHENFNANAFKKHQDGIQTSTVKYGQEKQGWMGICFEGTYDYNAKNNMTINVLGDVLDQYVLEIIREKMGDVYSPMLQMGYEKYPEACYKLLIMLSCNPDNTDKLANTCIQILKDVQKKGADKKTLSKVKKQMIATREKNIQTNNFWLSYINGKVVYNDDMNAVNEYADMVNSISKKDLVNFMKKYFKTDSYTRVDLKPEN